MTETDVIYQAFLHVFHNDHGNAAMHCAIVRYSPITFRLAEILDARGERTQLVRCVLDDIGVYEEDLGR